MIAGVRTARAIGGPFRTVHSGIPSVQGENDGKAPGVSELQEVCKNARLVHELCQTLHLEEGGIFRDHSSEAHHHHPPIDGAFILPE